jgi:PhnB protein
MAKVNPIPNGYHAVTPYLIIQGAGEAIEFYKRAFGAEEICRMGMPNGKVMHAELKIGDSFVMVGDEHPEFNRSPKTLGGTPVGLHLYVPDVDAAFTRAVGAGATVKMPPMDMFWGDRFGKVVDPFGHEWSIATHKEDVGPEEMGRRAQAAMAQMAQKSEACHSA